MVFRISTSKDDVFFRLKKEDDHIKLMAYKLGWGEVCILSISRSGKLFRKLNIPKELGFETNSIGEILISGEDK